ncbi:hypothetical protein HanPSC8_Chr06g0232981 [Helianthus annuus]|nr:hypothetical protein HanPSC8_Chr06g0232981 [Helianthus annuus]
MEITYEVKLEMYQLPLDQKSTPNLEEKKKVKTFVRPSATVSDNRWSSLQPPCRIFVSSRHLKQNDCFRFRSLYPKRDR